MHQRAKVNNWRGAVHNCIGVGMTIVCGKGHEQSDCTAMALLSGVAGLVLGRRLPPLGRPSKPPFLSGKRRGKSALHWAEPGKNRSTENIELFSIPSVCVTAGMCASVGKRLLASGKACLMACRIA